MVVYNMCCMACAFPAIRVGSGGRNSPACVRACVCLCLCLCLCVVCVANRFAVHLVIVVFLLRVVIHSVVESTNIDTHVCMVESTNIDTHVCIHTYTLIMYICSDIHMYIYINIYILIYIYINRSYYTYINTIITYAHNIVCYSVPFTLTGCSDRSGSAGRGGNSPMLCYAYAMLCYAMR